MFALVERNGSGDLRFQNHLSDIKTLQHKLLDTSKAESNSWREVTFKSEFRISRD